MRLIRALLILGRVSNLPTVWSNCLAGWLIGGAGEASDLGILGVGATLLYLGGMFLNDAFDASFDRIYRRERPIPSKAISSDAVWTLGFLQVGLGVFAMATLGITTFVCAASLAIAIILYDAYHKQISWSPVLMALCRLILLLAAASTGQKGLSGFAVWCAIALAGYIVGLSYIARRESAPGPLKYWPLLFLLFPVILAVFANDGIYLASALVISGVLAAWMLRCLWFTFRKHPPAIGQTVSGLLAGIVLVDLLALSGGPSTYGSVFCSLFVASLLFQKLVPAT